MTSPRRRQPSPGGPGEKCIPSDPVAPSISGMVGGQPKSARGLGARTPITQMARSSRNGG
eukprot:8511407-Pyramimonas_sp.AAC.1